MADYTAIDSATIEPNAPLISATMFALRDNPAAIAEGAAGAPRVQSAALQDYPFGAEDFQGGTAERDWVLARTSDAAPGAIGTYSIRGKSAPSPNTFPSWSSGSTVGGSALGFSGTWMAMGSSRPAGSAMDGGDRRFYSVGQYLRIS